MAASVFFYARVAHAIIYAFGWPAIRPLFYFIGLGATLVIAWQVLAA